MNQAETTTKITAGMVSGALVASLIGYGSTIALLLAAARAVGATPAQAGSWIFAICLAKAAGSAWLSWRWKIPAVLAWSTPGAALIAASEGVRFPELVGAFLLAGGLVALSGLLRPLGRVISRIPDGIAGAMLAGVLLPFCLNLTPALSEAPLIVLPMILVFVLVRLKTASFAVLAALASGLVITFAMQPDLLSGLQASWPVAVFTWPEFNVGVLIGLGVPLYLVTMASQNLPGFATLRAHGYEAPTGSALRTTGGLSMLTGLFGAHTVSMAAITAALCMGPDIHPDREARWRVGLVYAAIWVALAFLGPLFLSLLAVLPPQVMQALVGLALIGAITGAITTAFAAPETRFAAAVTFLTTGSGVAFFGVGAAFWGLMAGLALHALETAVHRR